MRWLVFIGVAALSVLLLICTPFPMAGKAAPAATRTFDIVMGEGKVVV